MPDIFVGDDDEILNHAKTVASPVAKTVKTFLAKYFHDVGCRLGQCAWNGMRIHFISKEAEKLTNPTEHTWILAFSLSQGHKTNFW